MSNAPATAPGPAPTAIVIGAGPAGLAAAACLRERGLFFELLERSDAVGSAWRQHYDRLHLHTIKRYSHLPGMPFPEHYPKYVPRALVVEYLEAYAERFGIVPTFGVDVSAVVRDGPSWRVEAADGRRWRAANVVLATGLNRVAVAPEWPGMDSTSIPILHSRDYRNGASWRDRPVLVVGMGNTGAEIALDLCEHGARAAISVRGPVNVVMRDTLGRPVHQTAMMLARLPTGLADRLGRVLQRLTVGDLARHGIERPALAPGTQLRTTGQTPTIDVGTVARIRSGEIAVRPAIERFEADAVRFVDGRAEQFDAVILCTGYRPALEALVPDGAPLLDVRGYAPDVGRLGEGVEGAQALGGGHEPQRGTGRALPEGLYLLGFDPYSPGGLLNAIARDASRVAAAIARRSARSSSTTGAAST